MHPVKAITIGALAWPAAEIVAFFCVAAAVGFANAILLIVLMSLAGLFVLRHFGSGTRGVRTAGGGFMAASVWSGGLAPGLGGLLLLIPGFLASALGIVILFPVSRRWLLAGFQRLFAATARRPADPDVIDLAPDEWRPLPGEKLPPGGPPPGN
jgi:UPF0716 protein FxsA